MSEVRIERLTGERLQALLPDLARLRIAVFRAFPYLYDGSLEYEERYLRTYAEAADSVVVGAFDGEAVIGASTGLPLSHEPPSLTDSFTAHGFEVALPDRKEQRGKPGILTSLDIRAGLDQHPDRCRMAFSGGPHQRVWTQGVGQFSVLR